MDLRERVAEALRTNCISTADMDDLRAGIALTAVAEHCDEQLTAFGGGWGDNPWEERVREALDMIGVLPESSARPRRRLPVPQGEAQ